MGIDHTGIDHTAGRTHTRVIACVDTGVDDAMALAYLLASAGECELVGVLAGYGNVDAATAERNTRLVLDLFGRPDIPVFRSSTRPSWADVFVPDAGCAQFHGPDGLGGYVGGGAGETADERRNRPVPDGAIVSVGGYRVDDPHANPAGGWDIVRDHPQSASPTAPDVMCDVRDAHCYGTLHRTVPSSGGQDKSGPLSPAELPPAGHGSGGRERDGVDLLIDAVRRYGRGVTVLATGPLTDVDAAIRRAPDIAGKLRLVMMGGTLTQPGNCWDAVAETNIIQDPEAADRVFHSGADMTMVGLDVTHQCLLPRSAAARWRATGTERGRFLARLADFSIAANRDADPKLFAAGMPLHDPLAAAVALDPTLVSTFDVALRAETATGDFTGVRGRTTGDPVGLVTPDAPRVHVALGVDADRFVGEFTDRLAMACADRPFLRYI
ncbi:nucleoside hydrolase [Bifidobacterium stellenboschense]|uniref:Urha1 n=1 Tax=Bifidobacterium stellenboschense TaxID=762211 RepID=A0A087DG04_9BIFI|nr:nucleoside hydrolase [Bifidobacterium stellenboschense]KFI94454.1 urha1 [Bifidobacterium stellenboschense]